MIRVLVVDDSPTARVLLVGILTSDPELAVVGEARDGVEGVELTQRLRPDVVTMDIHMPRLDGFAATKEIMITAPTPIVIATSSFRDSEVEVAMHALRAGAVAVLCKPHGPGSEGFEEACDKLRAAVKAMAGVKVVRRWRRTSEDDSTTAWQGDKATEEAASRWGAQSPGHPVSSASSGGSRKAKVVVVAASTGGPAALQAMLAELPGDFPAPIMVVQHITPGFTHGLAVWLNTVCDLNVKVAEHGERLALHTVYLAPDARHLGLSQACTVALDDGPPIGGFRPSASFLFESAARIFGAATVAVILTGMGDDGVAGLRALRLAGGRTLAQDEKSSVVFGMPGAAVAAGLADLVLPPQEIAVRLTLLV